MNVLWTYSGDQQIIVRVDGKEVYNNIHNGACIIDFTVPNSILDDGKLKLDFEFPNAISPISQGKSEDVRDLAFAFSSIQIDEVE